MRAVVVGGGLAGCSAALELLGAGAEVTLLEARPTLGGAVQTLPERAGDPLPPPDNGQHIALGCCSAYLAFLAKVGKADAVQRRPLTLPVVDEQGRRATIAAGPLALLRYGHLSLRDRLRVARAARRLGSLDPDEHDSETFGELLCRLGCPERAIERFWELFVRPALNLRTDEVSAALGIFTVQTALLGPRSASDLLVPREPLGAMHGAAAQVELERRGAVVRTRARVTDLDEDSAVLADGERIPGDAFVVALPPRESAELLGEDDPGLEDSPIVSVHLLFDRRILGEPLAALLGSPAHWIFDRGALTGHDLGDRQYLTVVSSGVPELMELRGRELVELIREELVSRLGEAELLWSRVSREPAATFAARPGTAGRRRGPRTARRNVARAGAWTSTGWPATMEGAIRSGVAAASVLSDVATKVSAA